MLRADLDPRAPTIIKKHMDIFRERMLSKRPVGLSEATHFSSEKLDEAVDEAAIRLICDIPKYSSDSAFVGMSLTELFRLSDILAIKADESAVPPTSKLDSASRFHIDQSIVNSKRPRTAEPLPVQSHPSQAAASTASQAKPQTKFNFQSARDKFTAEVCPTLIF